MKTSNTCVSFYGNTTHKLMECLGKTWIMTTDEILDCYLRWQRYMSRLLAIEVSRKGNTENTGVKAGGTQ